MYLYRTRLVLTTVLALATGVLLAGSSLVEAQKKQPRKGPRAIAVVEWQTDTRGRATPKLVPVAILDDGKFFDASVYRAAPVPMALETGTVYEAQDNGEILGYFTVNNAARVNVGATSDPDDDRPWIALGKWQTASPRFELHPGDKPGTAQVVKPGSTDPVIAGGTGDDRDDARKHTTVYDEQGKEQAPGADDGRPTLKKKGKIEPVERSPQIARPDPNKTARPTTGDDPDRPKLKRNPEPDGSASRNPPSEPTGGTGTGTPAASAPLPGSSPPATPSPAETSGDDPSRPILRRGKGPEQVKAGVDTDRPVLKHGNAEAKSAAASDTVLGGTVPQRVLDRGNREPDESKTPSLKTRTYQVVAVSDANEKRNAPLFRHRWGPDEQEELTRKMTALAEAEIDAFVRSRRGSARAAATEVSRPRNRAVAAKAGQAGATTKSGTAAASNPPAPGARPRLENVRITALEIDSTNAAELVLTARQRPAAPASPTTYIALVARIDLDGNPRKLFVNVTASDRLDAVPRLEFIDAVDADGDGRGDLLFRAVRGTDAEFILYKVNPDNLREIFRGGSAL